MGGIEFLKDLKDKVLDAASYDLLRRNFELLEENNSQLKDKADLLEEKVATLQSRTAQLETDNATLKQQVAQSSQTDEFKILDGVAFKRDAEGVYAPEPYCPQCHQMLSTVDRHVFICRNTACRYTVRIQYTPAQYAEELNKKK